MIKKWIFFSLILVAFSSCETNTDTCKIPDKPSPQRMVNDFAKIFSQSEQLELETRLQQYSVSTTTDIAVVTLNDFCEYDKAELAFKIIDEWGIGQKGKDNGLLILLKPKESAVDGKGEVFIAPGRGLEGAIPDATAKRIVEEKMIPRFKSGNYYAGVLVGVQESMKLANVDFKPGETPPNYHSYPKSLRDEIIKIAVFAFVFLLIFLFYVPEVNEYSRKNKIAWWTAFWLLLSSGNSRGGFFGGGFFGGGRSGSGGTGWGGFGGGSSGGGGAGGSW